MSFENGAGFRICGAVVRRFVPNSRKCAFLTLDVNQHPRSKKIEMRTFDRNLVDDFDALGSGQTVEVTGVIDWEPVKSKKGEEVKVDGYTKWGPVLTVKKLTIEGASRRPAPTEVGPTADGEPAPRSEQKAEPLQTSAWADESDVPF